MRARENLTVSLQVPPAEGFKAIRQQWRPTG